MNDKALTSHSLVYMTFYGVILAGWLQAGLGCWSGSGCGCGDDDD